MTESLKYSLRLASIGVLITTCAYFLNISIFGLMWASIAAYMVIDLRLSPSLKMGMNRLLGTVCGAFLGFILAVIFNNPSLLETMISFALIGFIGAIAFHFDKSVRLLAMTAAVIYILTIADADNMEFAWRIALDRAFDNFLGILLSMMAAIFIFPIYTTTEIEKSQKQLINLFCELCNCLLNKIQGLDSSNAQKIHVQIIKQNEKLKTLWQEFFLEDKIIVNNVKKNQQKLELLQLSYTLCYLLQLNYKLENQVLKIMRDDMSKLIQALANHFDNFTVTASSQMLTDQLDIFMAKLNDIRAHKILADFATDEIKVIYQFIINMQLSISILQSIQHDS